MSTAKILDLGMGDSVPSTGHSSQTKHMGSHLHHQQLDTIFRHSSTQICVKKKKKKQRCVLRTSCSWAMCAPAQHIHETSAAVGRCPTAPLDVPHSHSDPWPSLHSPSWHPWQLHAAAQRQLCRPRASERQLASPQGLRAASFCKYRACSRLGLQTCSFQQAAPGAVPPLAGVTLRTCLLHYSSSLGLLG